MKSKTIKHETVLAYEHACKQLAEKFVTDMFGRIIPERWFVANDPTGVLYVSDRFVSISSIYEYIKYKYTPEQFFKHYDYSLECIEKGESPINIKNWLKLKK